MGIKVNGKGSTMTRNCSVSGSPRVNLSNIRDWYQDYWWRFPFSFFNVLGILAVAGTDVGLGFVCSWQKGVTRVAEARQEHMSPRKSTSSTCPALCLSQSNAFYPYKRFFPHFLSILSSFFPVQVLDMQYPTSHSLTCNCFPSGTADPSPPTFPEPASAGIEPQNCFIPTCLLLGLTLSQKLGWGTF